MPGKIDIRQLKDDVEALYASAPTRADILIESYLENRLNALQLDEKLEILEKLTDMTQIAERDTGDENTMLTGSLSESISLLLGQEALSADLSSEAFSERLLDSFNTVFDNLNRLISSINMTLFGEGAGNVTIRHVIGSHIEGSAERNSLESYIGQINKAFLVTHQAFQTAIKSIVSQIIGELDPEAIESAGSGGLKLGVVKRAEFFDIYKEKHAVVRKWSETDRFTDKLLREFEKNCREISEQREG